MGGTCLGEVTYRISSILLNDKSRGFRRVLREAGAFIINPVRGVNRLVRGESWQVKQKNYLYHDINRFPLNFRVTVGNRYLADAMLCLEANTTPMSISSLNMATSLTTKRISLSTISWLM